MRVVGLTISRKQFDYAKERIFAAGLGDKVDIRLQDYRDERGTYDRIASIEMIEAVGAEYWPTYFGQLRDRLVPGGVAGIQAITIQDRFFDFLPARNRFHPPLRFPRRHAALARHSQGSRRPLRPAADRGKGVRRRLSAHAGGMARPLPIGLAEPAPLGFDERFRRLWEYYLAYCEAGFLSRNIDVRQMIFAKAG